MLVRRGQIAWVAAAVGFSLFAACGATADDPPVSNGPTSVAVDDTVADDGDEGGDHFWDDSEPISVDGPAVQDSVVRDGGVTLFVGDSVLVSISDDLAARVGGTLIFDAANCRRLGQVASGCGNSGTIDSGIDAIADTLDEMGPGRTPDVAVLVLANNSTITDDELDEAMDLLAATPRVWWVNARIDGFGRQDFNNLSLEALARRDPRARVIDWYSASDDPDLFRDHVHPNDAGQRRLARLIRDHLACDCVP